MKTQVVRGTLVLIPFQGQMITLPKLKDPKFSEQSKKDGIAHYQTCMDSEWERWQKDSLALFEGKNSR